MSFNFRFAIRPSTDSHDALNTVQQASESLCEQAAGLEEFTPDQDERVAAQAILKMDAEKLSVVAAGAIMLLIFSSDPTALTLGLMGDLVIQAGGAL
jgi:hypothetical protein